MGINSLVLQLKKKNKPKSTFLPLSTLVLSVVQKLMKQTNEIKLVVK